MKDIKEYHVINEKSAMILDGRYIREANLTEEEVAHFKAIFQTDKEKASLVITAEISKDACQRTFQVVKEEISSSPSRLH